MRYWWANQNQTFKHEAAGGYLWSPKRSAGNRINHFYETMREVSAGDLVFSFVGARIIALGISQSTSFECPKPVEFTSGHNWSHIGWKVRVRFQELENKIQPRHFMDRLGPLLPAKYSPLQESGRGNQAVYLAELPEQMALVLLDLAGLDLSRVNVGEQSGTAEASADTPPEISAWEDHVQQNVAADQSEPETTRAAVIAARRGQGKFRAAVAAIEKRCRVTGVADMQHLVASHIRPWRDCNNHERLDGENGFLLTPSIDHLFDAGFISFADNGDLLISPVADRQSLNRMGVPEASKLNVGPLTEGQKKYLHFHRSDVFKKMLN